MRLLNSITRYFSDDDKFYQDNFDGRYKYIKSFIPVPDFLRKILGMPPPKYDRRKKRFGRIRANPLYYISAPMIGVFILVIYVAVMSFETLVEYFNTGIYLNGLIISLMIFGILKTFHNSFMLYGTAIFFRKIEKVMYSEKILPEDIIMLRMALEKQGELVNTIFMTQTIDNIEKFGHPNFNDMRSRLIKSKLGFRIKKNRSNVNFIGGILVMLGLLGTFLGLLTTIDAVGAALNSMSSIGGETGEVGVNEMAGFISSLAAPLQGMGLAFSSSLFGLSGSLLIGFFLHLSGTPQNEFMENVSRWIDDREMKFDPNIAKGSKARVPPNDNDLKDWLSGFIHMSVKTNRVVSNLSENVLKAANETVRAWSEVRGLNEAQALLNSSTQSIEKNIKIIRDQGQVVAQGVPELLGSIQTSQRNFNDHITSIKDGSSSMAQQLQNTNKLLRSYMDHNIKELDSNKFVIVQIRDLINQSNMILNEVANVNKADVDRESLELLKQALIGLDQKQTDVLIETKELLKRLQQDPQMEQARDLVGQLRILLAELNKKTKNIFSNK